MDSETVERIKKKDNAIRGLLMIIYLDNPDYFHGVFTQEEMLDFFIGTSEVDQDVDVMEYAKEALYE